MLKIGFTIILIQLACIHSMDLNPSRNLQIVKTSDPNTGKNSLQSFHGTYLRGKPDGSVDLSYNVQSWETWTWIGVRQNIYYWQSTHGTYLSGQQNGNLALVKEPKEWELWKKVERDGKVYWQSYHGTYLSGGIDMTVSLQPRANGWQQWQFRGIDEKIIVKSSGPASIRSFHGSFLSASFQKQVSLVNKVQNEEKWTWLWLGEDKFAWKSFHHTYLSARQDGSVTLQSLLNGWEIWRRVDQNGKHLWKSFHGNYLSGTDNFKVLLQAVPRGWEQWQDGDKLIFVGPSPIINPNPGTNNPQAPGTNLRIINNCPYTIWPGLSGLKNDHTPAFGNKNSAKPAGFQLKAGEQKLISLAEGAISVRVWARTGCSFQTNNAWPDVKTRFLCQVGECGNNENKWDGTCYKSSGIGGNTLAQLTMTADGHWWYDISLVDGYTMPVTMNLVGKINKVGGVSDEYNCKSTQCFPNQSFDQCPPELKKYESGSNKVISCYSINQAINDNDLKRRQPKLQQYFNNPKVRSHAECSCLEGSCAGSTADEVARNIKPGTGFCCSPLNPLYLDPRIKDHICYVTQKPRPLNGFGGGKRYDQIFKSVCQKAYSWEFDDHKSTFECSGKEATMEVKFC